MPGASTDGLRGVCERLWRGISNDKWMYVDQCCVLSKCSSSKVNQSVVWKKKEERNRRNLVDGFMNLMRLIRCKMARRL